MEHIFLHIVIFCIVLFLYIHINFHIKTSDDLEVYTIEQPSKDKLEEICNIKQPLTFEYFINDNELYKSSIVDTYSAFDVKIYDKKKNDSIPLTIDLTNKLFTNDNKANFYTENNQEFLEETGLIKRFKYNDAFLRPNFVSNCFYDFSYGSNNVTTPLKYEINCRNYFFVKHGSLKIKLAPPKNSKYLYTTKDYGFFSFYSPVNPWNIQEKYKPNFNKIKWLELDIQKNNIVFIPPYWWYTFQFTNETEILSFKYRTFMNNVAILPDLIINLLQNNNTKFKLFENAVEDNTLESSKIQTVKDNTSQPVTNNNKK